MTNGMIKAKENAIRVGSTKMGKYLFNVFCLELLVIVIYPDIYIKVKTNITLYIPRYHVSFYTPNKFILKGKIISNFILYLVY